MSQRRTAPSSLNEGSGLHRVGLSLQETARWLCNAKFRRQCLACYFATITMGLAGTVYGWTKTLLVHVRTPRGDVPLTLTLDEYSWVVSLTVLGSMIGSLLAAQLADRIGRKYCLLVCSTVFTVGWFIIYEATSVPMLHLAGVTLGIAVGIAHTINPMFVSEVADIKYRGPLGVLIAANVNSGTLLSYALAVWLTYKLQLMLLVAISLISILSTLCFPETPYFLVAKGQKEQARKSIAYYKGIEDPDEVKIELRALREQVRYELRQHFRYELHQLSGSDLHLQSIRDLPSQSIYVIQSEVICEENQQPTGELHSQSKSELLRASASDIHQPSTSEIQPEPTREMHRQSASQIHGSSTSQILPQTGSELHSGASSDLRTQSSVDSRASMDIPEPYMDGTKYTFLTKLRALLQRRNRKALFIMLGLIMAQQLSGNFSATEYLEELIDSKSPFIDVYESMFLVQGVRLVSGYSATVIVAYFGRKTLLIVSTIGSCISCFILAGYLFLDVQNVHEPTTSIISVYILGWYQVSFQIGLGMLPNVLLCELFPTELKGIVGAIVVIFNGIIGFTASTLNHVITDNVEWHAIFIIFATSCSLAFLMVLMWVPETKGKTYDEIETLLVGENLNSLNEEVRTDETDVHRI